MSKLIVAKIVALNIALSLSMVACKQKDGISNTTTSVVYNNDSIKTFTIIKSPRKNLLFIEAKINNKKGFLLLDTGASMTVIDKNQLTSYNLESYETGNDFSGIGGSNTQYQISNVNEIQISDKLFTIDLKSADISNVVEAINQNSNVKIVGILGSDFFSKYGVMFDYDRKLLLVKN